MNNQTIELRFKTNINCPNCIKAVSPFLNEIKDISWEVDTSNPDKILTVKGENPDPETIISTVEEAGFDITQID
jgi:copper chaperone